MQFTVRYILFYTIKETMCIFYCTVYIILYIINYTNFKVVCLFSPKNVKTQNIVQTFPKKSFLSFAILAIHSLTRSLQSMRFWVLAHCIDATYDIATFRLNWPTSRFSKNTIIWYYLHFFLFVIFFYYMIFLFILFSNLIFTDLVPRSLSRFTL